MRDWPSILHLDLDAFFAAVEQRDKPSLRGKAVVVGGVGARGVVATASYEARRFGVRSAMSAAEAHRRAPHAAFLGGRFDAYQQSSRVVMGLLGQISPLVEPLSLDEAYVDLAAGGHSPDSVMTLVSDLRAELTRQTEGLTASVGLGTSKFMAKVASELAKPNGVRMVPRGAETETISPLPVRVIPGVGPVAEQRLSQLGMRTVADVQAARRTELVRELGSSWGNALADLALAQDERPVNPEREAKSISTEDTFETDLTDVARLHAIIEADAASVAGRLARAGLFARTVSIKVRLADFTTFTRARTLPGATGEAERIAATAKGLLAGIDIAAGVRLLGVGTSGFALAAQEPLFEDEHAQAEADAPATVTETAGVYRGGPRYRPGAEVEHPDLGRGWVWGSGLGRVSVRFETRYTGVGPVRTLAEETLSRAPLLPLAAAQAVGDAQHDPHRGAF
ncbi:MAG: DNA polymerase IV [Propionibacteriaceae bacterium]|nr:DNA polymerase IV [Propionibacteriaceae bacterium]